MRPIERAIAAHQRGNVAEAESLYRRILAADNRDFDALHMLGIICAQRGQFEQAEQLLRTALSIDASIAQCLQNYGNILYHLGRDGMRLKATSAPWRGSRIFYRHSFPWSACC
jgi:protein O-GlcNAc transferase